MIDAETMIKLKGVMIKILDEFVRICDENNLSYFLTSGTLLGAVRHNGYVPWDDDIDVGMPRADFDKFVKTFSNIENSEYYLLFMNNPGNYNWIKLCKKNTIYFDKYNENYQGIYIDIWYYDNSVKLLIPLQASLVKLLRKLYWVKKNIDNKKWYIKYPFRILTLLPDKFFIWLPNKICRFLNNFKTGYITALTNEFVYNETYKRKFVFPLTKLLFEGKYYSVPWNYDHCLKARFGNYMELPPAEKRISSHAVDIVFDTSAK